MILKKICVIYLFFSVFVFPNSVNTYVSKKDIAESKNIFINEKNSYKNEEVLKNYRLKYANSKEISKALNGINGIKVVNFENNLVLTGDLKKIKELEKIIDKLDKGKKQVLVKATIIDTSLNLFDRIGFNWKITENKEKNSGHEIVSRFLDGTLSFGNLLKIGGNFLGIDINLLKENGDINLRSTPSLLILDDEEGILKITEEIIIGEKTNKKGKTVTNEPFFSEAGLIFKIKPKINNMDYDEKIVLNIESEVSNFKAVNKNGKSSGKQKNIIKTTVVLKNGGSAFIGGLNQNTNKNYENKLPFLGDIPLIGNIFKYKNKNNEIRELYVELEAKIIE